MVTNEAAAWQLNTAAKEGEAVLCKKWGYVVLIRALLLIGQSGLKITAQAAAPASLIFPRSTNWQFKLKAPFFSRPERYSSKYVATGETAEGGAISPVGSGERLLI